MHSTRAAKSCQETSGPHRPPVQHSSVCLQPAQLWGTALAGGYHRGMFWGQWRVPSQGWWAVGEGEGHSWGSQQARG